METCRGCGPKHCNLTEGDVSGGGFFLSEPSSRALDHAGSSRTSRALSPTLGSSALSTSAPRSRGVSAGTYSRWALIHLLLLLNLDVHSWESGHLMVLHFCSGGLLGGSLQQQPGTLEGCSQERRGEPGPLPGEAAWGKDRPPPL